MEVILSIPCIPSLTDKLYNVDLETVWTLTRHGYMQHMDNPNAYELVRARWGDVTDAVINGAAVAWRFAFGSRTGSLNTNSNANAFSLTSRVRDQEAWISRRFHYTFHSRQVLGLHHWATAPWHFESLKYGKGLPPFSVWPHLELQTEALRTQQRAMMVEDQEATWAALLAVAGRRGISPEQATTEVSLAPWLYVAYPPENSLPGSSEYYSQLGAEILQDVRE